MKVVLRLTLNEKVVYEGAHEMAGAEEFGSAFEEIWNALHARRLERSTSVGELMSQISEDILDDINGCTITIERR